MQLPTIHLNGTGKDRLAEGYLDTLRAVQRAREVMADNGPNGRDYYPQGATAFRTAVQEHISRLRKLQEIEAELTAIVEHIEGA